MTCFPQTPFKGLASCFATSIALKRAFRHPENPKLPDLFPPTPLQGTCVLTCNFNRAKARFPSSLKILMGRGRGGQKRGGGGGEGGSWKSSKINPQGCKTRVQDSCPVSLITAKQRVQDTCTCDSNLHYIHYQPRVDWKDFVKNWLSERSKSHQTHLDFEIFRKNVIFSTFQTSSCLFGFVFFEKNSFQSFLDLISPI